MMPWLLSGLGFAILLVAGDVLVRGAVNLSLRLGLPALIVSLTIVAFGTSAPELLVSISAILDNAPGLALGNVVGSNTANILMVLGIPALLATMHTSECSTRKSYVVMLLTTALFIGLAFRGSFDHVAGAILLAGFGLMLADMFRDAHLHRQACLAEVVDEVEGADPDMRWWKIFTFIVLGLVGLPLGANLLVENATVIARTHGVSESAIGLTLVAAGTSFPELATTVMAALRRQADVAIGNVIGSNIFNLLGIIGISSFFGSIPVDPTFMTFDLWAMLAASLLLVPFVFLRQDITRIWGVILSGLYMVYLVFVLA